MPFSAIGTRSGRVAPRPSGLGRSATGAGFALPRDADRRSALQAGGALRLSSSTRAAVHRSGTGRSGDNSPVPASAPMSYLDLRSDLFRRAFHDGVSYRDYLTTGSERERAALDAGPKSALPTLPEDASISPRPRRPDRERAVPERDLVRGLRPVGPDRGPAGRGSGSVG